MNRRSGEESKRRILRAAVRVFSEHGYANANMRLIAREAGISVGGVYLYVENKEQLYLMLMKERMETLNKNTEEMIDSSVDSSDALRKFISTSLLYAKEHKEALMIQSAELGSSFGIEMKSEFFLRRIAMIQKIIQRGVDEGVFECRNPREAAKLVFSMIRGFFVSIALEGDFLFDAEECSSLVLTGLLKRSQAR